MTALRICVLEDPKPSGGLAERLRTAGIEVEFEAGGPEALIAELDRRLPMLALVDASHAGADRIAALDAIARRYPGLRIVAAVAPGQAEAATRLQAAGAWNCVTRRKGNGDALAQELAAVAREPRARAEGLTPREREVLGHLAGGCDNLKIAALLGITERTAKAHVGSLYLKLGARSRVELALAGRALG